MDVIKVENQEEFENVCREEIEAKTPPTKTYRGESCEVIREEEARGAWTILKKVSSGEFLITIPLWLVHRKFLDQRNGWRASKWHYGKIIRETEKAVQVETKSFYPRCACKAEKEHKEFSLNDEEVMSEIEGDGLRQAWLPKSQIKILQTR